ncbi:alpha/beta hydrolase [Actinoplanes sp. NPDC020271]|uniref:alpha/beta hydrolase n=1 Tax=Actinoplanes sp. NPDC020271 TaxID=3363896 RepID=UPI0037B1D8B6
MSELTLDDLLSFDATPWHTAADHWHQLAQAVDDAAEELIRGTRDLPYAWSNGTGAEAAAEKAADLRAEVSNTYNPAKRIYDAMDQHAYGMKALRQQAEDVVAAARKAGYTVDTAAATITAPAAAYSAGNLDHTARETGALLNDLRGIVGKARSLDDSTANTITVNTPSTTTGFGTGQMQALSRADLEAQGKRSPAEIRAWWESLTPQQQEQAILEFPDLVGGMDGVPIADRDVANRSLLRRDTDVLRQDVASVDGRMNYLQGMYDQGRIDEVYPGVPDAKAAMDAEMSKLGSQRDELAGKLKGLAAISSRLADPAKPDAYLIGLSADGDGRAIVSVGNPDTADNILTYVPGTGEDLSKVGAGMARAGVMQGDAAHEDPTKSTAAVYWYGYDAPNDILPDAGYSSYAQDGGPILDRFQTGLRATHEGDIPSRNTVLGHSYGSTVIGHAATSSSISADAVVFVGSPGVDVDHATDLHGVRPDQVYATRAEYDAIRKVPDWDIAHGNDPSDLDFGARVFASDPGDPNAEGVTHSAYWNNDNIARKNIALIVTGKL